MLYNLAFNGLKEAIKKEYSPIKTIAGSSKDILNNMWQLIESFFLNKKMRCRIWNSQNLNSYNLYKILLQEKKSILD